MSYQGYSTNIEYKGCRYNLDFKKKIEEIIEDMENRSSSGEESFKLEVENTKDGVRTMTKHSIGLSDIGLKHLDELEQMAQEICKQGGKPSKIKSEVEVEKEI